MVKSTPEKFYRLDRRGHRDIQAPRSSLERVHHRLFHILRRIEVPPYLISGQPGLSYLDNAKAHQETGHHLLTVDIKKFFSSCRRQHVFEFFQNRLQTAPDIAALLTNLCCYQGERLALGSPVSQVLSFWVNEAMFGLLAHLAHRQGLMFTVYVDDLSFSSLISVPKGLLAEVVSVIHSHGLRVNWRKIRHRFRGQPKEVTGCVITKDLKLEAPLPLQAKALAAVRRFRNADATRKEGLRALGLVNAVRYIAPMDFRLAMREVRTKLRNTPSLPELSGPLP